MALDSKAEHQIVEAAKASSSLLENMLEKKDVEDLKQLQLLILGRLQDSNAVLAHFNDFSERSFLAVSNDFSMNTKLLRSMKVDLDHIFQRLRNLKSRIASLSPDAFTDLPSGISDNRPSLEASMIP